MQDEEQGEVLVVMKQCETLKVRVSSLNLEGKDKLSVSVKTSERVATPQMIWTPCFSYADSAMSRT